MTNLLADPQLLTTAAADAHQINTAQSQARAAAVGPTTSVAAAAADEISAAAAQVFGAYGAEYQGLLQQASLFHEQFAGALASAAGAYAGAETAAASLLGGAEADVRSLLGGGAVSAGNATVGLFIGGSGLPVPPPSYLSAVLPWVNFPSAQVLLANAQALFTPEGLYPTTGVKSLPLNTSVAEGVQILESAITQQLPNSPVAVLGYSQSAIISSLVMRAALNGTYVPPTANPLTFTLLGDPMAPNGGLFERFVGLQLPSVGLDFYGATPSNTPYPTNIYTLQYDGYADFPKYPGNFIADLNAFAGILEVHGTYPSINPSALPPGDTLVQLPTSPGYTGATHYYMITQPNLPLLDPIRAIPGIGNPIADLLQPDLRAIVNYGYGNPYYGYNTGYADLPTPFSVFPPLSDTMLLGPALATGTQQGITAFVNDITHLSTPSLASMSVGAGGGASLGAFSLPTTLPTLPTITPTSIIQSIQTANTDIFGTLSADLSSAYSVLLPTADIANALLISLPAYDVNLFLSGIQMAIGGDPTGGLAYAFAAPIAADIAIGTLAAGFELEVLVNAVTAIV